MTLRSLVPVGALRAAALSLLAGLVTQVHAQAFTNLDFEQAVINEQDGTWQQWENAAPGWGHSTGDDTDRVFWRMAHVGISQLYLLAETDPSQALYPLPMAGQGRYAMAFHSGHASNQDPDSPWVQAFIEQAGVVPGDARSIRLLAEGEFQLTLGGQPIDMVQVGPHEYAGDISLVAGTVQALRITHVGEWQMLHVDDIRFSAQPVPEPGSAALALGGVAALAAVRRKRF